MQHGSPLLQPTVLSLSMSFSRQAQSWNCFSLVYFGYYPWYHCTNMDNRQQECNCIPFITIVSMPSPLFFSLTVLASSSFLQHNWSGSGPIHPSHSLKTVLPKCSVAKQSHSEPQRSIVLTKRGWTSVVWNQWSASHCGVATVGEVSARQVWRRHVAIAAVASVRSPVGLHTTV